MQIEGTLEKFPLRELIEMILYSSVTGVLELRTADGVGQIFFRDGHPYHASAGDRAGVDAVCGLFEEHDAMFRFVAGIESADETLWMDPFFLLERAEREAQQWVRVRPHIPSLDWVPVLCSNVGTEQVHINEETWRVLSTVDGQRSVRAIVEYLNLEQLDTCLALVGLIERGLVAVRPPLPQPLEPRPAPAAARRPERPASGGFFERLIAGMQPEAPLDEAGSAPIDEPELRMRRD